MNRRKTVPDPLIVLIQAESPIATEPLPSSAADLNQVRVKEFLQSRSLAPKSQKAYQQDLQHFLDWVQTDWAAVTSRQIAQFRAHLLQLDLQTQQRIRSDATMRRILGTLKSFYRWMMRSGYVTVDPTTGLTLPQLKPTAAQTLNPSEIQQIYACASKTNLPKRNIALISLLLHGLRAEEISALDCKDYEGDRLQIGAVGAVPLELDRKAHLDAYLQWRQIQGEALQPESALFVSHSRRNTGTRLSYDSIRKVMEAIAQQTGIEFNTQQFRHTFAANLVQEGLSPQQMMSLTRHKSAQSCRRYTSPVDPTE
jgi:integrase/recombinase XerD